MRRIDVIIKFNAKYIFDENESVEMFMELLGIATETILLGKSFRI